MPSFGNQGYQKLPTHDENECDPSDPDLPQARPQGPPQDLPQVPPYKPTQTQFQPHFATYYDDPNHQQAYAPTQLVMVAPGPQTMRVTTDIRHSDWTVPAILACIFCFWPVGIFAIIYANKADTEARCGNAAEAHKYARQAKILTIISFAVGVLIVVGTILTIVIPIAIAVNSLSNEINPKLTTTEIPLGY